jgi:hypothetical protein
MVIKELGLQEESLLRGIIHTEVLRWDKKGGRALDRVEFLQQVQKDKGVEDHDI